MTAYEDANRSRLKMQRAAYYAANRDKLKAQKAVYYAANRTKRAAYVKANSVMASVCAAERRAKQLQATPAWADKFFMQEAYALAALRTKILGFKWHVDHVVPLRSKIVCGRHCEANLRVIPAVINMSKGNRYWPDMP
jgi:hypothetical protein